MQATLDQRNGRRRRSGPSSVTPQRNFSPVATDATLKQGWDVGPERFDLSVDEYLGRWLDD